MEKLLTVITPSYNSLVNLVVLFDHLKSFNHDLFYWIIADSNSSDGTIDFFSQLEVSWLSFISEKDLGIYDGLNKGLKYCRTEFYVVSGADDLPDMQTLLSTLNENAHLSPDLILGNCFYAENRIKQPFFCLSKIEESRMSFHSVGTIFRTKIHDLVGFYSTTLRLASDELLFQKIIRGPFVVSSSNNFFGHYSNSGLSSTNRFLATLEMFYVRSIFAKPKFLAVFLFVLKLLWHRIRG